MNRQDPERAGDVQIEWPLPPAGDFPALADGEIQVWAAPTDAGAGRERASRDDAVLDPDERRRARRCRRSRDRRRFRTRRFILRRLLAAYLDTDPGRLRLGEGEHGKPRLRTASARPGLEFSLAHSDGVAVYAMARDRPVGIDVERARRISDILEIAERHFTASEVETLRGSGPDARHRTFLRIWTRKEAFLKGVGVGLTDALASVAVDPTVKSETIPASAAERWPGEAPWTLRELGPASGWLGAVAVQGDDVGIGRWRWEPGDPQRGFVP